MRHSPRRNKAKPLTAEDFARRQRMIEDARERLARRGSTRTAERPPSRGSSSWKTADVED
jgi:hypothetical protein